MAVPLIAAMGVAVLSAASALGSVRMRRRFMRVMTRRKDVVSGANRVIPGSRRTPPSNGGPDELERGVYA